MGELEGASRTLNQKLWDKADADREKWVQSMTSEVTSELSKQPKQKWELGDLYGLGDFKVKRVNCRNLVVGASETVYVFSATPEAERQEMKENYKAIHLDGMEFNCQMKGGRGLFACAIFDSRYILPFKGFVGLVFFNLAEEASTKKIRFNYSVSAQDMWNWIIVFHAFDHGLLSETRPCNIALKAHYKYTNHSSRFFSPVSVGRLVTQIEGVDSGMMEATVRESLDYTSKNLLTDTFKNNNWVQGFLRSVRAKGFPE